MLIGVENRQGNQGHINDTPAGEQGESNKRGAERSSAQGEAQRHTAGGEFALEEHQGGRISDATLDATKNTGNAEENRRVPQERGAGISGQPEPANQKNLSDSVLTNAHKKAENVDTSKERVKAIDTSPAQDGGEDKGAVLLSLARPTDVRRIPFADAAAIVNKIAVIAKEDWNLDIILVASHEALPEEVKSSIANNYGKDTKAKGVVHNGSIRAVIAHGNIEAVLVKNAGNNTWLLNGWEIKPVASDAANDTSGATLTQADSSDLNVGAGLGDNNAPDIRFSQDVRMLAPSRNVRFLPNRNVRWSAGSCLDRGMLFFGRLVSPDRWLTSH